MKNLLPKLQQYITIVGVITAIGGGFYTWGQFNLRLDNIEKKKIKTVNIAPLETKVEGLEKRLDRIEGRVDKMGNNDNPLAN
jgi:tetrahydromethanopterin S-methyltransferase subunit G|tara:strand:- start:892 stop:1137 length:246 start_codon:yes stop_codon:yes gene_type:complete